MMIISENKATAVTPGEAVFLRAEWPAPANVKTLISTRQGGVSHGVYAGLNVGTHVGDEPEAVARNRALVQAQVDKPIAYLNQTHSVDVLSATAAVTALQRGQVLTGDASVARGHDNAACAVMTADCLPVLLCDTSGQVVAAAHAGWRGLAGGIIQQTVRQMNEPAAQILAYLGPAIGPDAFEVGQDVRDAFCQPQPAAQSAFSAIDEGKYLADIYMLARLALNSVGVRQVWGGEHCTVMERSRFFSYRRNGQTGRMVSVIWLEQ